MDKQNEVLFELEKYPCTGKTWLNTSSSLSELSKMNGN